MVLKITELEVGSSHYGHVSKKVKFVNRQYWQLVIFYCAISVTIVRVSYSNKEIRVVRVHNGSSTASEYLQYQNHRFPDKNVYHTLCNALINSCASKIDL